LHPVKEDKPEEKILHAGMDVHYVCCKNKGIKCGVIHLKEENATARLERRALPADLKRKVL
jgi:uncharacterized metal-binding protein